METVYRPWGKYEVVQDEPNYKIKIITVEPMKRLSLQYHDFRTEHWTIVEGTCTVILDDQIYKLTNGQSIIIPVGIKHRLKNISELSKLVVIEVQTGKYLGEADITRVEDDWAR